MNHQSKISFVLPENPQFIEMADDKEVDKTIAEDLVVTKYKLAGQIVNRKFFPNYNFMIKQQHTLINWPIRRAVCDNRMDACHRMAMRPMWRLPLILASF